MGKQMSLCIFSGHLLIQELGLGGPKQKVTVHFHDPPLIPQAEGKRQMTGTPILF